MKYDEKELNIKVTIKDLIDYMNSNPVGFVYLKTGTEFEMITLYNSEYWFNDNRIAKWINEGRLFRRRNKPFESMMA